MSIFVVKAEDVGLIQFLYPHHVLRSEISRTDVGKDVIFTGLITPGIMAMAKASIGQVIVTKGKPEVDLTSPETILDFVYQRWSKPVPKYVQDQLSSYSPEEIVEMAKVVWVSGKWPGEETPDLIIYSLFASMMNSINDVLKTYFDLERLYAFQVIESSFLTFLNRSKDYAEQNVSPTYSRLLRIFNSQYGQNVKPAIQTYVSKHTMDPKARFLDLLLNIKR